MNADDQDSAFLDLLMLALLGFIAIVILLLPYINPPRQEQVLPPGNILVEISWPNDLDADVDLWVEAPGDVPVGYSNKGGKIFNLLRDDLGSYADISGINYEVAYSRGLPAGEYTINIHLYRNLSRVKQIPVAVIINLKSPENSSVIRIHEAKTILNFPGEELTIVRFKIDHYGRLVGGSTHDIPKKLRSSKK